MSSLQSAHTLLTVQAVRTHAHAYSLLHNSRPVQLLLRHKLISKTPVLRDMTPCTATAVSENLAASLFSVT